MSNKKISQLTINTSPSGGNLLPIVAGGTTMAIPLSGLTLYVSNVITGVTFNNNILSITNNNDITILTLIDNFSGLTINGNLLIGGNTINNAKLQVSGNKSFGVIVSAAGSLNLTNNASTYIFTGITGTWSLPTIFGKTGWEYTVKNRGNGILTMNVSDASNTIYGTSVVPAYNLNPGEGFIFINDGTYWAII